MQKPRLPTRLEIRGGVVNQAGKSTEAIHLMTEAYILFCQKENSFGYTTFIQVYTDLDSAKQAGLKVFSVHTDGWRGDDCGYERSQVTGDGDIVWILKQAVDVMPDPDTFAKW